MKNICERRCWPISLALMVGTAWLVVPSTAAAALPARFDSMRRDAERHEKDGHWAKALEVWAELLSKDRGELELRDHYQHCLRHLHQLRRHADKTFRDQILNRDALAAIKVYGEILNKLKANYVDRESVGLSKLFRHGVDELLLALNDETFRQEHLADAKAEVVQTFQMELLERWGTQAIAKVREAQDQAMEVALACQRALGIRPTVVLLEFACGACDSLDEFTYFLTPAQLGELFDVVEGDWVDVGLEVKSADQKLAIAYVAKDGPAALAGLRADDLIVRIDKKPAQNLAPEIAREKLRGESGSVVEIEVRSPGRKELRTVLLTRHAVRSFTVLDAKMRDEQAGIGYIRLAGFQKTTLEELNAALLYLRMQGMRALVLDLRENPGGLFPAAVQVAERFLPQGIIVSTQSRLPEYNRTYEANNMSPVDVPLVLLVDGETASAAEVLAGALKDNRRATLVGQTTFGKGCIQCVLPLESIPVGGIRITLAKFFSPRGQPYNGIGVTPHIAVDRSSAGLEEGQLQAALQAARDLTMMQR